MLIEVGIWNEGERIWNLLVFVMFYLVIIINLNKLIFILDKNGCFVFFWVLVVCCNEL